MCKTGKTKKLNLFISLSLLFIILILSPAASTKAFTYSDNIIPPQIGEWETNDDWIVIGQDKTATFNDQRSSDWVIECAYCEFYFYEMDSHNIRLDQDGYPHIVFGGDHLYYAYYDNSGWHGRIVDRNNNVGGGASLDLDSNGKPHISYFDEYNRILMYRYFDGEDWYVQQVVSDLQNPKTTSLSLDSNNLPHIAYIADGKLTHSQNDGDTWSFSSFTQPGVEDCSLDTDTNDNPNILFISKDDDSINSFIYYSFFDGNAWDTEKVDDYTNPYTIDFFIRGPSITMDSQNNAHISYGKKNELMYGLKKDESFDLEQVKKESEYITSTSVVVDEDDIPHLSFTNSMTYFDDRAGYAVYNPDHQPDQDPWIIRTVFESKSIGYFSALAVDTREFEGKKYVLPYFIYVDEVEETLNLSFVSGGELVTSPLANKVSSGEFSSIAVDSEDSPRIAHKRNLRLVHTRKTDSEWITSFLLETLGYISIAVDSDDMTHCVYTNRRHQYEDCPNCPTVMYATFNPRTVPVEIEMLYSTGSRYKYTAIAVDSNDKPHIGYFQPENNILKYIYRVGSDWLGGAIDENNAGYYLSMDLDGQDFPHFSYQGNGQLKYKYFDGNIWHEHALTESAIFTSIKVDDQGLPHISYSDEVTNQLKYAYFDGDAWDITIVDSTSESFDTAIGLDSNGKPHIAYYGDSTLKYAYYYGNNWFKETVDDDGDVGKYVSIALDSKDHVHISYFDASNRDLKYAHLPEAPGVPSHEIFLPILIK